MFLAVVGGGRVGEGILREGRRSETCSAMSHAPSHSQAPFSYLQAGATIIFT